jgi:carbamoyltransferase
MLNMARYVHRETGMKHLCLAGGVALNCVANGRVVREVPFESIWIQPAAGDAGGSLGVALAICIGI